MTSLSVGNTFVCLVNDVADHLRSPTCLARETEFLAVEFGSLVLRETPDPIEDPESKLQALVLLLTLTEYSSRRNDAVVGMLKWLMKSTNLARLDRVVLNLMSNKTRGRPSVDFLTDVVDMLSGFFRGSRRTAVILDSRVWFSELEEDYQETLEAAGGVDDTVFTVHLCNVRKTDFYPLLKHFSKQDPERQSVDHIFFPLYQTVTRPITPRNIRNPKKDHELSRVYTLIIHNWVLFNALQRFTLLAPDATNSFSIRDHRKFDSRFEDAVPELNDLGLCRVGYNRQIGPLDLTNVIRDFVPSAPY